MYHLVDALVPLPRVRLYAIGRLRRDRRAFMASISAKDGSRTGRRLGRIWVAHHYLGKDQLLARPEGVVPMLSEYRSSKVFTDIRAFVVVALGLLAFALGLLTFAAQPAFAVHNPPQLTLEPATATNTVGEEHC